MLSKSGNVFGWPLGGYPAPQVNPRYPRGLGHPAGACMCVWAAVAGMSRTVWLSSMRRQYEAPEAPNFSQQRIYRGCRPLTAPCKHVALYSAARTYPD